MVPGPSAVSRRLTEYIKGVGQRFQVVVLSLKTADNSHIQKYHGARLLRVPVGAGDLPAQAQAFDRAVRRQLESEEYVLAHVFDPFGGAPIVERAAELGYSVVYDACTFPSLDLAMSEPALDPAFLASVREKEAQCIAGAQRIVTGSELARRALVTRGAQPSNVKVLRAPIDRAPFTSEVMGPPNSTPMTLMHLGSVHPWTGLDRVIDAMAQIRTTVDVRLKVVGELSPEVGPSLRARIDAHGLAERVEIQPPVAHEDIFKVLASADVGLLSLADVERNRLAGGPLARLGEYLAAGRPVLAADLPLARELAPPGATVFYDASATANLADVVAALANDAQRRVALGAAARMASSLWDAGDASRSLLGYLAELIGAGSDEVLEVDSNDITQSGQALDDREPTQGGAAPFRSTDSAISGSGPSKVKTDPAIRTSSDSSTDANAHAGPPPIMGVPLRENTPPPLVSSPSGLHHAPSEGSRSADGLPPPLATSPSAVFRAPDSLPPPLVTSPSAVLRAPNSVPPPLPTRPASGSSTAHVPSASAASGVFPVPSAPSGVMRTAPPPLPSSSGSAIVATPSRPLPVIAAPPVPALEEPAPEPEPLEEADVHAVEAANTATPPTSALDPWFAQLVHGYCPPEAHSFARHVPPTTMPGKS
ncbi:MAG: glycosyltransferase [Archangium sp.]|nr:glycosyltransferase [Archangium sp.]